MKFLYLTALSLVMNMAAHAQQSWKLMLDNKVLLQATEEEEEKNVVMLPAAAYKKAKQVVLLYGSAGDQKGWERTIALYDEADKVLATAKGRKLVVSGAALRSYLSQAKTLRIYTTSLPKDPQLAARVRVRRVHLVTMVKG